MKSRSFVLIRMDSGFRRNERWLTPRRGFSTAPRLLHLSQAALLPSSNSSLLARRMRESRGASGAKGTPLRYKRSFLSWAFLRRGASLLRGGCSFDKGFFNSPSSLRIDPPRISLRANCSACSTIPPALVGIDLKGGVVLAFSSVASNPRSSRLFQQSQFAKFCYAFPSSDEDSSSAFCPSRYFPYSSCVVSGHRSGPRL